MGRPRIALQWKTVDERLKEICLMHGEPGPGPSVAVWTSAADYLERAFGKERTTAPWLVGDGPVRAIAVGARRERFRTWIHDEYWVVAGGPFQSIVAAGRGIAIDQVRLVRVSIDPYPAGRRDWMTRKIGNELD